MTGNDEDKESKAEERRTTYKVSDIYFTVSYRYNFLKAA